MSYANISDMLAERGISVDRSTIYRWFIEYSPSLRKKLRHYQFINTDRHASYAHAIALLKNEDCCERMLSIVK